MLLGSANTPVDRSSTPISAPASLPWSGVMAITFGAWLVASRVKVRVAVLVPSVPVTTMVYLPSSVAPAPVVLGAFLEAS